MTKLLGLKPNEPATEEAKTDGDGEELEETVTDGLRFPQLSRIDSELKNTSMKAMIVEVCFVDSSIDAEIYKRVGHDAVGKAIAEGIVNQKVPAPAPAPSNPTGYYRVVCGSFQNKNEAAQRQAELKAAGFDSFLAYYEK